MKLIEFKMFFNFFKPKREIQFLQTVEDIFYEPVKFKTELTESGFLYKDECTIKHLGKQIYLIGYFDHYKQGFSTNANRVNRYIILFPSSIKSVSYK